MHPNRHAIAFGSLVFLVVSVVLIIAALFWGWPKYKVYKKEMDGIAALKEAESVSYTHLTLPTICSV